MSRASRAGATAEAYVAALAQRDLSHLSELVATDLVGREPGRRFVGIEALERNMVGWFEAFPRCACKEDLFAAGDRFVWRGEPQWHPQHRRMDGAHERNHHLPGGAGQVRRVLGQYDRLALQQQLEDA